MVDKNLTYTLAVVILLIGFLAGYLIRDRQYEEVKTVTKVVELTDTVYVTKTEKVYIPKKEIEQVVVRDTILVDYEPNLIRSFTVSRPFLYGNTNVSGEVLGEVLSVDITNDFKIPTITNTIERTTTTTYTKKPSGLFLTVGAMDNFTPSVGGVLIRDKVAVGYQYGLNQSHSIQFGYKIF